MDVNSNSCACCDFSSFYNYSCFLNILVDILEIVYANTYEYLTVLALVFHHFPPLIDTCILLHLNSRWIAWSFSMPQAIRYALHASTYLHTRTLFPFLSCPLRLMFPLDCPAILYASCNLYVHFFRFCHSSHSHLPWILIHKLLCCVLPLGSKLHNTNNHSSRVFPVLLPK